MGLIQQAKDDWQRFSSDPDLFGISIDFEAPTSATATVVGLATKHNIGVDTEGNLINTKNAHISVAEKLLTDAGYPTRNTAGEVDLKKHRVDYIDSTGGSKKYVIQQSFPDETVGMIVCILEDFE